MTNDKKCRKGAMVFLVFSAIVATPCIQAQVSENQTTTWKGTLIDSGCRSAQTERHGGSMSVDPGRNATTSFALITKDGKCIPLDEDSNEKVSGMLKINTNWSENSAKIEPTKVEVVGTKNAGTISVDEIEFVKVPSSFTPATPNSWPVK